MLSSRSPMMHKPIEHREPLTDRIAALERTVRRLERANASNAQAMTFSLVSKPEAASADQIAKRNIYFLASSRMRLVQRTSSCARRCIWLTSG